MKKAIVLSHADIVTAITAFVVEQEPNEQIDNIQLSLNGDGEATAVINTVDAEPKATGRGSRKTSADTAEDSDAKPARTRRGRNTDAESDTAGEEEAVETKSTRSRRGAVKDEEVAETKTRTRRGSKAEAKPTVPVKSEDDYDLDEEDQSDENTTYWQNTEDASDVFAVPAGQVLPAADLYDEIESEEAALALIADNSAPEEAAAEPETKTRTRRGRETADDSDKEEVAETETTGRTRTRRGAAATEDKSDDAPASGGTKRRLFKRGG